MSFPLKGRNCLLRETPERMTLNFLMGERIEDRQRVNYPPSSPTDL